MEATNFLLEKLEERKQQEIFRSLNSFSDKIDFCSNDYLGFAYDPRLHDDNFRVVKNGSTGSRLISGNSPEAEEAERIVANFHKAEAALIFNTGYMANVGLFSCLAGKDDTYITDEHIHASIIDGVRLSHASKFRFRHNDLSDLESKLLAAKGRKFVAVESLYSMDGDEAPLLELVTLCRKHDALLIVDEAHANGVQGKNGEGMVCEHGLENEVFARTFTFGKALGLQGAAVAGSSILRDYLVNFARSFIYSTALPPVAYQKISTAYEMLKHVNRQPLFNLIHHFRNAVKDLPEDVVVNSRSQIQGIILGDNVKAKKLSAQLLEQGMYAKAILSPTVPVGSERLRISLHLFNTTEEVDQLVATIKDYFR